MADPVIKVMVTGQPGVGKTSLQTTYIDGKFTPPGFYTIGVDFRRVNTYVNGRPVKALVWDTRGGVSLLLH